MFLFIEKELKHPVRNIINIIIMVIVNGISFLTPLVIFPLLAKSIGVVNFGYYVTALAIVQYGILFNDFGFNSSATRSIALDTDIDAVSTIYIRVTLCKIVTFFVFIFAVILYHLIVKTDFSLILIILSFSILSNIIFPVWLFQGLQTFYPIAVNSILKILCIIPLVYFFVNEKSDVFFAAFIYSLVPIFVSLFVFVLSVFYMGVNFRIRKSMLDNFLDEFKSGWYFFVSQVSTSLYTTSNVLLVGALTSPILVSNYSVAERLKNVIQGFISPIASVLFPTVVSKFKENKNYGVLFSWRIGLILSALLLVMAILLSPFSSFFINALFGKEYTETYILSLMLFNPAIVMLNVTLSNFILIPLGKEKEISRIMLFIGPIHIIHATLFIYIGGLYGAAISNIITECLVFIFLYFLYKNKTTQ